MLIKAKVLPFSDKILPPVFSNNHKQYLIEKNKEELPKILRGKKPKNQKLKRYLNKINEIKKIESSKLIIPSLNKSFAAKPDFKSVITKGFNNDENGVKLKKSKKPIFKKRISTSSLKILKPSTNLSAKSKKTIFKKRKSTSLKILKPSTTNLSANELFSILDGPDYRQLRSGVKYKNKEE